MPHKVDFFDSSCIRVDAITPLEKINVHRQYEQHFKTISVRYRDNPAEWRRQYYFLIVRGLNAVPKKRRSKNKPKTNGVKNDEEKNQIKNKTE